MQNEIRELKKSMKEIEEGKIKMVSIMDKKDKQFQKISRDYSYLQKKYEKVTQDLLLVSKKNEFLERGKEQLKNDLSKT